MTEKFDPTEEQVSEMINAVIQRCDRDHLGVTLPEWATQISIQMISNYLVQENYEALFKIIPDLIPKLEALAQYSASIGYLIAVEAERKNFRNDIMYYPLEDTSKYVWKEGVKIISRLGICTIKKVGYDHYDGTMESISIEVQQDDEPNIVAIYNATEITLYKG